MKNRILVILTLALITLACNAQPTQDKITAILKTNMKALGITEMSILYRHKETADTINFAYLVADPQKPNRNFKTLAAFLEDLATGTNVPFPDDPKKLNILHITSQ